MEQELFQLYDTDVWGSHASRTNLGVFSSVKNALYSLVKNPKSGKADIDRLNAIFKDENRLFVEKITVDKVEGYSQVFDSDLDECKNELKRIIIFEAIQRNGKNADFLKTNDDENSFDIILITHDIDFIKDKLIDEFLPNWIDVLRFIKKHFIV